ncbi:glutamic acid-rich protein isoform X2 [Cylas formicarius]|uniref:glutamic acid-rich protein isoform X2 n=1 Tax=Cylas formicarius TaxID=197179 RepID=UPI0029589C16|nr:glutamic acid-rich protein isoform X2 [Cylas formicarius]
MAVEVKLSKSNNDTAWGFRLVGGIDFGEPVTVVKINEGSIAEDAALEVGDIVEQINGVSVDGLTHKEVHDLIYAAGTKLLFVVKRDCYENIPMTAEEYTANKTENNQSNNLRINGTSNKENVAPNQHIAGKGSDRQDQFGDNREKKWSTFLQKPKGPKPVPKKQEEERKIIGEPYRVRIVKQKKRDPNEKKAVRFENVPKAEDKLEEVGEEYLEIQEESTECNGNNNETSQAENNDNIENNSEPFIEEESTSDPGDLESEDEEIRELIKEEDTNPQKGEPNVKLLKPILKNKPLEIRIDPVIESTLSLEQQLAAVQKQLLALSQLPSAIQVTLEAVTQQLNNIVMSKSSNQETENGIYEENGDEHSLEQGNNSDCSVEEEAIAENGSYSENAEGDVTENEDDNNCILDAVEEEETNVQKYISSDIMDEGDENVEAVEDKPPELTEEEKEEKRREEEILAKKQKEIEARKKMDWAERPIILPGGRRWSGPDDTTPHKCKNPKLSDEKISKMIETYSEVLVGKTKGINFLKYQPPPKNLSYLQNSEVYRLIHGMDQPMRGVGVRAEKILSEKDYYGDNGAP